ncbi:MAG: hypothetical protein KIT60_12035 [Burkholderiaceae bacterium]|nr:hypothetical protein [Burkholderiaceae bacterium]
MLILHCGEDKGGTNAKKQSDYTNDDDTNALLPIGCKANLENLDAFDDKVKGKQVRDDLQHSSHW